MSKAEEAKALTSIAASMWPQIVAALAATLGSFGCGTGIAWSSPVLPKIKNESCYEKGCDLSGVSDEAADWIGPLFPLGAIFAGPLAFFLLNKIGRKKTLLWLSCPMLIGYILLTITKVLDSLWTLFIGRFLVGFSGGAYALVAPYYVSEIAETSMRGALASLMQLMVTFGVLFVNALNIYDTVHWVTISGICIGIPVAMVVMLLFMPDSPKYLIAESKTLEARKALQWFRGPQFDVDEELRQISESHHEESKIGSVTFKELLSKRVYWQPFLIAMFGMFGQQFCGINVVFFYQQTIFEKARSSIDPTVAAFLVAVAQCCGTGAAVFIVDRFGRKILLILSNVFMALPLAALGTYFYMDENRIFCENGTQLFLDQNIWDLGPHQWQDLLKLFIKSVENSCHGSIEPDVIDGLGWLPVVSLVTFVIAFAIGFGPLCWTINAEIFPPEAKRLGSSIAFSANWTFAFLVTKFEPYVEDALNTSGAYFLFSAICLFGTFIIVFFVPETKGKSPEEMKAYFEKKTVKSEQR